MTVHTDNTLPTTQFFLLEVIFFSRPRFRLDEFGVALGSAML